MKFTAAWNQVLSQNLMLKIALGTMLGVTTILAVTTAKVAAKPPLIVERACTSKVMTPASAKHTKAELTAFLKDAIPERFNSEKMLNRYVSSKEWAFRLQEQKDLTTRQLRQTVLVSEVKISDKMITVAADRLIAVGEVRAAFNFPLQVETQATERSEINPYGLILTKVTPLKLEQTTDEK